MSYGDDFYSDVAAIRLSDQVASRERPFGSGWLIGINLVVTAKHVIAGAGSAGEGREAWDVRLHDGRSCRATKLWLGHDGLDIALLDIKMDGDRAEQVRPRSELKIAVESADVERKVVLAGFPRGFKEVGKRDLLPARGGLTKARELSFAVHPSFQPEVPQEDWPGCSGGAIFLHERPDPDKIWLYGVAESIGPNFTGLIKIAALSTAWRDRSFREIIRERSPGIEAPSDPFRPDDCPFRGLEPFRESDARFFFGRGREIAELSEKISTYGFVALMGSSGAGKSSLVHGGLIPELQRRDGVRRWDVISFRPGTDPLRELVKAVYSDLPVPITSGKLDEEVTRLRQADPQGLARMCGDRLDRTGFRSLLLYVEQWEELYLRPAYAANDEQYLGMVDKFVSLLVAAASDRVKVLISIRLGFSEQLDDQRPLRRLFPAQRVTVRDPENLRDVIVGPARAAGLTFEPPVLIDQIEADAQTSARILPHLQYALKETWKQRVGKSLTDDGYLYTGGVEGAIERAGKQAYDSLSSDEQAAARRLFLQLVSPDAQTSTPIEAPVDRNYTAVVKAFESARLVVTERDQGKAKLEIAHAAVIKSWTLLQEWIRDNEENLRLRALLLKAKNDRRSLREFEITSGKTLLASAGDVEIEDLRDFIQKSVRAEEERRAEQHLKELKHARIISEAPLNLLSINGVLEGLCDDVKELGFEYVAVQLIDRGEQTIETVFGRGLQNEWKTIAKHSLEGSEDLLDIQAHIVNSSPPVIEIIAGWDDRFDKFIWERFGHRDHIRIFAPILRGYRENWRWIPDRVARPKTRENSTPHDRRSVYRLGTDGGGQPAPDDIIGTVETGFSTPEHPIDETMAARVVAIASLYADALHEASLNHVLNSVADAAHDVIGAENACIIYRKVEGDRFRYEITRPGPRPNECPASRSMIARSALKSREPVFTPRESEERPVDLADGLQAEAAVPIWVPTDDIVSGPSGSEKEAASPHGLLYVNFRKEHFFTGSQIASLGELASSAGNAIRVASHLSLTRSSARRMENLVSIATSLAREPAADNLLRIIAGYGRALFGADVVTVYEYSELADDFDDFGFDGALIDGPAAQHPKLDRQSAPHILVKGDKNIFARRARSGFHDPPREERRNGFVDREQIISAAGIILKPDNEAFGVMFVNFRSYREFSPKEEEFASTLAGTAGAAIRTRRIMRQAKRK